MRRDDGALFAVLGTAALAAVATLRRRGSGKLAPADGQGGVTFDLKDLLSMQQEPTEPPMCDIYLLNSEYVDGFFVNKMLHEVFGLDANDAHRLGWTAHTQGQAHIVTMGCEEAREKVEEAKAMANREHPPAARVLLVIDKD